MNQLLMQMLAAGGGVINPTVADLLAQLNSPGANGLNVEDLLARQVANNPMAAMLAKHFAEQKAVRAANEESSVIEGEACAQTEELEQQQTGEFVEEHLAELNGVRAELSGLTAELKLLQQRNDLLAAALGACCLCWGQNLDCRSCRGRGGPGFCIPDECLFEEFVVPAIRTLRAQRANHKNSPPVQSRTSNVT
jgi:hypothetical protein